MMKKFGILAALLSVLVGVPQVMRAESLADAMVSAYRNSGLLDQQRALLRAKDEDLAIAQAAFRPVINYAINARWSRTDVEGVPGITDKKSLSATITAGLTLYDFGRSTLSADMARENVMMARDMLVGVEQNVLLRAVSAFLKVRSAHETALLRANNVRLLTEQLRAAKDRFTVGEITSTEVSLAQAALAGARAAEAAARGQLMIAREEYKAAVGHYPNGLQVPPRVPVTAKSLGAAKGQARVHHPDVLVARRNVTVAEMGTELSKRSVLPTLSAEARLTAAINHDAPNTRGGVLDVTLAGPIYHGGKLTALYRKSLAQAEAARAGLHLSVQQVEQNVGNAWAQLAIATASIEATDRQIRASRVALRGAREEQALGARTMLEVLDFEQDLLNAEASRISAITDQHLAAYNLLAAMGLLTVEHLGLGIATYDPSVYYNAVKDAPLHIVSPQGKRLDSLLEALGRD